MPVPARLALSDVRFDLIQRPRVERPTERDAIVAAAVPALCRGLLEQLAC